MLKSGTVPISDWILNKGSWSSEEYPKLEPACASASAALSLDDVQDVFTSRGGQNVRKARILSFRVVRGISRTGCTGPTRRTVQPSEIAR